MKAEMKRGHGGTALREKRFRRRLKHISGVVAVLAFLVLAPLLYDRLSLVLRSPETAIYDGVEFLLQKEQLTPDVYMLLGQVALMLEDSDLTERLKNKDVVLSNPEWMATATAEHALDPRLLPEHAPVVVEPLPLGDAMAPLGMHTLRDREVLAQVVSIALLCEDLSPVEFAHAMSRSRRPGEGYVLAHQVLALDFIMKKRCLVGGNVRDRQERLLRALAQETGLQQLEKDLDFERLAMLALTGHGAQLQKFVPRLLSAQAHDGGWGEDEVIEHDGWLQTVPREHASVLALYALTALHKAGRAK